MNTEKTVQPYVSETTPSPFRLSVAIPLHNEEEVIPALLSRLGSALGAIEGGPHEVVLVDDGSTDRTAAMLEDAARIDPRLVVVVLSRNFGHQAALTAALDHVSGDAVIMMDADLQDRPEAIPLFLEKFREGYDVVYAQRMSRKESLWLRASYKMFYRILNMISDMHIPMDAGDFGLVSRRVVLELRRLREHHRYLRGLRSWVGLRQIGIEVERDARAAGDPKYDLWRLFRLAFDGIFSFSTLPIRVVGLFGMAALAASGVYALYTLYAKLVLHISPQGFTAIIIIVTFLSGVNLIFLGVIGEYLGRVYEEVKTRPVYIVDRVTRRAPGERAVLPERRAAID
jgi:glycosyltransferase involved in cell wall biosynthesis